jgi:hypothetical protein
LHDLGSQHGGLPRQRVVKRGCAAFRISRAAGREASVAFSECIGSAWFPDYFRHNPAMLGKREAVSNPFVRFSLIFCHGSGMKWILGLFHAKHVYSVIIRLQSRLK